MKALIMGSVVTVLLTPAPSHAYSIESEADLQEICAASPGGTLEEAMQASYCAGFIRGTFEQLWVNEVDKGNRPHECLPESLTNRQIVDLVKAYLDDHPARRDALAIMSIRSALREAYPTCFS